MKRWLAQVALPLAVLSASYDFFIRERHPLRDVVSVSFLVTLLVTVLLMFGIAFVVGLVVWAARKPDPAADGNRGVSGAKSGAAPNR